MTHGMYQGQCTGITILIQPVKLALKPLLHTPPHIPPAHLSPIICLCMCQFLQAAAWLQSQATSAAALSASHPLSETSAAASSVAIPPYTSSSFSQQVSLGKHRRHASTTDLVIPDPDIPSSPQSRVHATGRSGFALEAASASFHSKVLRSGADAGRADIAAEYKPATSAPVSGQESLDKAAAALRSLRDKFGQKKRKEGLHANPTLQSAGQVTASSGSSFLGFSQDVSSGCSPVADMVSSTPSNRAAAVPSTTRSTFDFKTAVGGKTVLAGKSADTSRHVGESADRHLRPNEHHSLDLMQSSSASQRPIATACAESRACLASESQKHSRDSIRLWPHLRKLYTLLSQGQVCMCYVKHIYCDG